MLLFTLFILTTLCMTFISYVFVIKIGVKNRIESIGLSFLVMAMVTSFVFFIGYQLTAYFSQYFIFVFSIISSVVLLLTHKKLVKQCTRGLNWYAVNEKLLTLSRQERILILIILCFVFLGTLTAFATIITDWDAVALYDFRAILIKHSYSWFEGIELGYFFHYPPFTSLLHAYFYVFGINYAKLWYIFLYGSFLIVYYSLLRRVVNRYIALIGTSLMCIAPLISEHVLVVYTNMPYSVYFSLGMLYAFFWIRDGRQKDLLVAAILTAFSTWIRSAEPFWLLNILFLIYGLVLHSREVKLKNTLYALFFCIGVSVYWNTYINSLHLPVIDDPYKNTENLTQFSLSNLIVNILSVLEYLFTYVIRPLFISIVLYVYVVLFEKNFLKNKLNQLSIVTFIAFLMFVFSGTLIFSFTYRTWSQIGGSLTRMVMFIVPILMFTIFSSKLMKKLVESTYFKNNLNKVVLKTSKSKRKGLVS